MGTTEGSERTPADDGRRFAEPPTWLASFRERVRARCPGCSRAGVVVQAEAGPRFVCPGCMKTVEGASWLGPMIGFATRPCGACGRRLHGRRHSARGAGPAQLALRCECGAESAAELHWTRHWTGAIEPSFGLKMLRPAFVEVPSQQCNRKNSNHHPACNPQIHHECQKEV